MTFSEYVSPTARIIQFDFGVFLSKSILIENNNGTYFANQSFHGVKDYNGR
jgi:hypothetical protein